MRTLALAAVWALSVSCAFAQASWTPKRNVEIVVGVAAGGNMDRTARAIQAVLQEDKLIPVSSVVVNKPGGGQALGLQYVKFHVGNPYFLSVNSEPLLTNRIAGRSPISYTDFTPIAQLFNEYVAFTVKSNSPIKSAKDLEERLKRDPASITAAIGAARGNVNECALALWMGKFGADVKKVRIPIFNGTGQAVTALLGGHVDLVISTAAGIVGQLPSGRVRVLAITAPHRLSGALASVPTLRELGYNVDFSSMRVVLAPKHVSTQEIGYWDDVFAKLVETRKWKQYAERFYWIPDYMDSAKTAAFLRERQKELRRLYVQIGLAK